MQDKRFKTQMQQNEVAQNDQTMKVLQKIISISSRQKLLSKFINEFDTQCGKGHRKRLIQYKKIVKNLYGQEGKVPLKFDPQEAMTDQQKLRKKILKLQNNELQIDYFDKMKLKQGKIIPAFKGYPLQKVNYPTKKQFMMFKDFNENKFLKSYSHLFEDQLQLRQTSLFRKQRVKTIAVIPQHENQAIPKSVPNPKFNKFHFDDLKQKQKGLRKVKNVKLKPLTQSIQKCMKDDISAGKKINEKYRPHIEKTKIGRIIKDLQSSSVFQKMKNIGSFPISTSQNTISLTKESLSKYLKSLYERQVRIVDFLQVKSAFSFQQYTNLCRKLKLMSVQHVVFMTFLFYDFNNDGYICDNDIRRIRNIVQNKRNFVIEEDLKLIQSIKQKKQYENKILSLKNDKSQIINKNELNESQSNYLQLYKFPQITESTYFVWLNKEKQRNRQIDDPTSKEQKEQKDARQRKGSNPFNPSVLKFKYNYCDEKSEVRKYIMNIKAKKTYIDFHQFRNKYLSSQEPRNVTHSLDSRVIQSSKHAKEVSKNSSNIGLSRYEQSQSQIKLQSGKKQQKIRYKQVLQRPFLWYDLMNKLGGVRFQGLKYE